MTFARTNSRGWVDDGWYASVGRGGDGGGVVSFNVHANQLTWVGWIVRVGGMRGGRGGVVSFDVHANQLTWVGRGGGEGGKL